MEPFEIMVSESQERMLAVVEPARVDEVLALCERWETGAAVVGEVTVEQGLPRPARRRGGRRDAGRRAGRRVPALRPRAGRAGRLAWHGPTCWPHWTDALATGARTIRPPGTGRDAPGRRRAERCLLCWRHRASPASAGRSSSTTRSCSRTRSAAPRPATPRSCTFPRPGRRSRSRSTATGAGSPATRTRARSRRCSSARRTSPASAPQPLGLTNCLNFGNPEKPAVAWQLDRSTQGLADACVALGGAGRRRQRLALQRDRRRADLPDPGRRHGRRAARPASARAGWRSPTATRSPSAVRSRPRSAGSELDEAARRARSRASGSRRSQRSGRRSTRCARRCGRAGSRRP